MSQIKIYGLQENLNPIKAELSDVIQFYPWLLFSRNPIQTQLFLDAALPPDFLV